MCFFNKPKRCGFPVESTYVILMLSQKENCTIPCIQDILKTNQQPLWQYLLKNESRHELLLLLLQLHFSKSAFNVSHTVYSIKPCVRASVECYEFRLIISF
jgi:hypothetical protein